MPLQFKLLHIPLRMNVAEHDLLSKAACIADKPLTVWARNLLLSAANQLTKGSR